MGGDRGKEKKKKEKEEKREGCMHAWLDYYYCYFCYRYYYLCVHMYIAIYVTLLAVCSLKVTNYNQLIHRHSD